MNVRTACARYFVALSLLVANGCAPDQPDDADHHDDDPTLHGDGELTGPVDGETYSLVGINIPTTLKLDTKHIFYPTFDDGPSPATTPKVLDVLKKHGVHATFFITGGNIAGNEALLQRERDEGHLVANHQWKHIVATEAE